jgi:isopentenyl diphosphate isomerase/L-lactate dehydrogenase-like FMN-dependent dehydrogenase
MAQGTIPRDLSKLEEEAAKVLSPEALAYILAGAGDRDTTRANAAAFKRWKRRRAAKRRRGRRPPKVDLSTTILGTRMPAPVLFAPVGVQTLAHPDGELATAPAAAELGLTYVHSTQASHKMEDVARANGRGPRWYQLYWPTDDELAVSFLRRAKAAGYTHLIITLDTTLLGWRPLDLDRGYSPFLENKGIANYTSDPVFQRQMPLPANVAHGDEPGLRRHPVSNERARRGASPVGTIHALPEIAAAVGGKVPVLFGSGVRTAPDVYRALALGADAVLIGRP